MLITVWAEKCGFLKGNLQFDNKQIDVKLLEIMSQF